MSRSSPKSRMERLSSLGRHALSLLSTIILLFSLQGLKTRGPEPPSTECAVPPSSLPASAPLCPEVEPPEAPLCPSAPVPEAPPPPPEPTGTPSAELGPGSCLPKQTTKDKAVGLRYPLPEGEDGVFRQLSGVKLVGVSVSPTRAGVLAAWTERALYYSDSDGARFVEILEGPGLLYDVVVDCRGSVYALRGTAGGVMLGVANSRGETWRLTPLKNPNLATEEGGEVYPGWLYELDLFAGGGWVGLAAEETWWSRELGARWSVMTSGDGGASWHMMHIQEVLGENEGVVPVGMTGRRLRLHAWEGDCMYTGSVLQELDLETGEMVWSTPVSYERHSRALVKGRWAYDMGECEGLVCVLDLKEGKVYKENEQGYDVNWKSVSGIPQAPLDLEEEDLPVELIGGGRVVARVDSALYALRGRGAEKLSDGIPPDTSFIAVDAAGRVVGLSGEGGLLRWSPRRGLRLLLGALED